MDNAKKKWAFIINPVAGNGFAKSIVPKLEEMIIKNNISAELAYTERSGHATELSAGYLEKGFSYIIGVGGDGTFNEIARPLINKKNVITGLIPAGTGNDFIQILGFPGRFGEEEWDIFFNARVIAMDVGSCNGYDIPERDGAGI